MKTSVECFACVIAQARRSLVEWEGDDESKFKAMLEASKKLAGANREMKPIEMSKLTNEAVKNLTDMEDLYVIRKKNLNDSAMKVIDDVIAAAKKEPDHFKFLLKGAILGNHLDLGINEVDVDSEIIERIGKTELAIDDFEAFMNRLERSKFILYILDNTGEVVFDKALIDFMKTQFGPQIRVAVRSAPIINDVTKKEALEVGFEEREIIDSGSTMAGMTLEVASEEFMEAWDGADLIISKGQGNFEGLEEIEDERLFFLLEAKCTVVSKMLGIDLGGTVLKNSKRRESLS